MHNTEMICPMCQSSLFRDSDGFLVCLKCGWEDIKDVKMPKEKMLRFCANCQKFYDNTEGHNPSHLLFYAYGTFLTHDEKSEQENNENLEKMNNAGNY